MSTVEVKAPSTVTGGGPTWRNLYEVPAGKAAVVRSVLATNTSGVNSSCFLGVNRGGVITSLANAVAINNNSTVNLIPSVINLEAGDILVSYGPSVMGLRTNPGLGGTPRLIINNAGTTIAFTTGGIWRSIDGASTWTQVSPRSLSSSIGAYIAGSWFLYTSSTTAIRSSDNGLTWSDIAVTGAPIQTAHQQGNIVTNGTLWAGLASSTQMATTTDGVTWSTAGITAFPNPVSSLRWTGTHFIAGRDTTVPEIYRSTNGASWSTVTVSGMAAGSGILARSIATNGSGIVVAMGGNPAVISRSTDHGATWSAVLTSGPSLTDTCSGWTGSSYWFMQGNGGSFFTSTTGELNTWVSAPAGSSGVAASSFAGEVVAGSFIYADGSLLRRTTNLNFTDRAFGLEATAAILEITP